MTDYPVLLNRLLDRQDLDRDQMRALMHAVLSGALSPAQIAAALAALRCKGETIAEIAAAADVMRALSTRVELADLPDLVDTCGTGGDGAHTFNISTAAAITAAAAGVKIAKHGGRSVSSICGSADVLEALGVNVNLTARQVAQSVREIGIGFMFAPNHHSAMKHAAPVRRELGVRTLFNLLGPLTNPAGASNQVMGVYSPHLPARIAHALNLLGSRHVLVVHGAGGMDELSLAGESHIAELQHGSVTEYSIDPAQFGLAHADTASLRVTSLPEATALLRDALGNRHRAAADIVTLNAGAAIYVGGQAQTLAEGVHRAGQQISSGAALAKLDQLIGFSQHV